jgi:magnesium transporter
MITTPVTPGSPQAAGPDHRLLYFSKFLRARVCETRRDFLLGKLTDLVFRLSEPYPEAVGIYLSHGWGRPSEFVPWERVARIEPGAVFVLPPESGECYPPFVDQPGWILLNEHLMGKTILDMEGRGIEVVNDVQLLESRGRMIIAHVDVSFNGFLRKWGLDWLALQKARLIAWRYVQPLSIEDVTSTDKVSLSITKSELAELPSEDLADSLEELSGEQQEAVFSVLDTEKAAETLLEAEPRAQRQLVASLHVDRARAILGEMSTAQLADLLSALPLDDRNDLITLLPGEQADRIRGILSEHEARADALMSTTFLRMTRETRVGEALARLRGSKLDAEEVWDIFVVLEPAGVLLGVVDLRELVMASDDATLEDVMATPGVSANQDVREEELAEMFVKYHLRMLPIVDTADRILGVIHYRDVMK